MTPDVAYLVKNGMPYEAVIAMSPKEQKAALRAMKKVERSSPAGRIFSIFAGLVMLALGGLMLFVLLGVQAAMPN